MKDSERRGEELRAERERLDRERNGLLVLGVVIVVAWMAAFLIALACSSIGAPA